MSALELLAIAVALAMDALAVAVATGIRLKRVSPRQTFRLAWHFGLFQALMPIAGWAMGLSLRSFMEHWAHWIAFALLAYIGGKMIKESFEEDKVEAQCDPTRGATLVMLSVATSIDALAVGFSLSLLGVDIWYPSVIIGIVALLFTAGGIHLGKLVASASTLSHKAEFLGGVVLILIGIKIVAEHI